MRIFNRAFGAAMMLVASLVPAAATQKTPAAITTEINTLLPDNNLGRITAANVRQVMKDIVDSYGDRACTQMPNLTGAVTTSGGACVTSFSNMAASNLIFNPPGTGGTARTQNDKDTDIVDIRDYGASPLSDISTSLNNAISAAESGVSNAFGSVNFGLNAAYTQASGATAPQSMRITGCNAGVQQLTFSALTAVTQFVMSGELPKIECFILSNSNANPALTAATGVQIGVNSSSQYDPNATVRDITTHGYNIPIFLNAGAFQRIDNVTATNFGTYGMKVDNIGNCDAGDATISAFTAQQAAGAGVADVYWRGSGGMKVPSAKLLGSQYGWYNEPRDDGNAYLTACNSQDFLFSGSVENQTAAGIAFHALTHSTFRFPVITGFQMANMPTGVAVLNNPAYVAGTTADIGGSGSAYVGYPASTQIGYIGGGVLAQMGVGVELDDGANGWVIGPIAYGAKNIGPGTNGATNGAAQTIFMTPTPIWDRRKDFGEAGKLYADDKQQFINITSNVTYSNIFQILQAANRGGRFEIVVEGSVTIAGVATAFARTDRFFITANATQVPTVTAIDTFSVGPAVDIQKLVSGTNVLIGARLNAAGGGTVLSGTITILPEGKFEKVTRL